MVVLIQIGYAYQWTGFGQSKVNEGIRPSKTLWDWLDLLVVPAVLALGGYWFHRSENQRAQQIAERQRDVGREIADERQRDDMLQAYLDGMSELLLDEDRPLRQSEEGDEVQTLARSADSHGAGEVGWRP